MRTAKIRKNKKEEKQEILEEEYSFKKIAIILVSILLVFGVFYFITTLVVKPAKEIEDNTPAVLDSSKILLSGLLTRSDDEYFVLATHKSNDNAYHQIDYNNMYNNYISQYKSVKDALSFYYVNLDEGLNSNYISDKTNITNNLEELKLSEDTLFRIKKGKIKESYVGHDKIIEALKKLIPED